MVRTSALTHRHVCEAEWCPLTKEVRTTFCWLQYCKQDWKTTSLKFRLVLWSAQISPKSPSSFLSKVRAQYISCMFHSVHTQSTYSQKCENQMHALLFLSYTPRTDRCFRTKSIFQPLKVPHELQISICCLDHS